MSYTATSHQEVAAQKLRRMLSLSATFQLLCDADEDGALNRVKLLESDGCFPRASVVVVKSAYQQNSGGSASWQRPNLTLMLSIDIAPDLSLDPQDRLDKGFDQLFSIFNEVNALAGVDDTENPSSHLNIIRSEIQAIDETPEERRAADGLFYWMDATFEIGDGP